jgi:hypothetical protein
MSLISTTSGPFDSKSSILYPILKIFRRVCSAFFFVSPFNFPYLVTSVASIYSITEGSRFLSLRSQLKAKLRRFPSSISALSYRDLE